MTRTGEQAVSTTPFARVLTRFMWTKTPPWSAAKTAAVLGIHRTRVANWVYRGIVPELDTMLVVMAKLGIPLRELLDAYAADGVPIPAIEPTEGTTTPTQERAASYAVPGRGRARAGIAETTETTETTGLAETAMGAKGAIEQPSAQPLRTEAEREAARTAEREAERNAEWEKMLAHTREVMSLAGMPQSAIEAMLNDLKDTRDGKPSSAQRRIVEEHQPTQGPTHGSTHGLAQGSAQGSARQPRRAQERAQERAHEKA